MWVPHTDSAFVQSVGNSWQCGRGQHQAEMGIQQPEPMLSPALYTQLEATLDLAERRRIRSAIRELQRQELERDEETLASKRFRPERSSHRQDNKENWPQ